MKISPRGLKLVEDSEGCRLKAYRDTGGVWTIGYGHTKGVRPGDTITPDVAVQLLNADLQYAINIVNAHALPCTQGQFDALVDFVFNLGPTQFLGSSLFKYHKLKQYDKAAAEFPRWKYDNGVVQPGLVKRRAAEQALYILQEPQEVRQRTDESEHSVESVPDPVEAALVVVSSPPSVVPPSPEPSIVVASGSGLSGFLSQASEAFRKLIASIGGAKG
jgi:lysozyme